MISVIIPTYNTASLVERAINSVLSQNGSFPLEVLIVDDCSTDNTQEKICRIKDPRIRIFFQPRNLGPAAARNRGLHAAHGEFCAFLDGDDYWFPDFLLKTVRFLVKHKEAVAVSVAQCHKIIGKPPMHSPQNTGIKGPILLEDFFSFWAKYNHVCTGSVLMRTAIAQSIGGQREDLRICEDLEFWALLATRGLWGFIPEVLFTSDGGVVTREQGWIAKNKKRWASAVSVSEWKKRPEAHLLPAFATPFELVCGRIASGMSYSLLLSGRICFARNEVRKYGKFFPNTKLNKLMVVFAKNRILWYFFCKLLYFRECLRCLK